MKLNITQSIKDYDGKDYYLLSQELKKDGSVGVVERLGVVADLIIYFINTETQHYMLDPEDKHKVYRISSILSAAKEKNIEVELSVEDMSFILERLKILAPPVVHGQISDLFNAKTRKDTKDN